MICIETGTFLYITNSRAIKNYILLRTVERLKIPYRQKKYLYSLVIILGDPISYKNGVIYLEMELIQLQIKGRNIYISFNILLLGNNKAVLRMPWLREYNFKINQVIGQVDIKNT